MNENPEGTPNPLNPVQGVKPVEPTPGMATGTGTLDYSEPVTVSPSNTAPTSSQVGTHASTTNFTRPANNAPSGFSRPGGNIDGFARPNGTAGNYNRPTSVDGFSQPSPRATHAAVDPLMRPASRPSKEMDPYDSFEALSSSDSAAGMAQTTLTKQSDLPELTARDSIVEPAGKKSGKKKPLIIGAVALIVIAVLCGVTAVVLALVNNGSDKVSKAIDKLLNGEVSTIINAEGNVNILSADTDEAEVSLLSSANIKINATFDTTSSLNATTASLTGKLATGTEVTLDVIEATNKSGETFVKIDGVSALVNAMANPMIRATGGEAESPLEATPACSDEEDCIEEINLGDTNAPEVPVDDLIAMPSPADLENSGTPEPLDGQMSIYGDLAGKIDDKWILLSTDSTSSVSDFGITDPTTCAVNAAETLKNNLSSLAKAYKENSFISASTEKLTISKKKNDLYRLDIDEEKLAAFEDATKNSLSAIEGCDTDTSDSSMTLADLLDKLSAIYVEIDDDYNFTRVYFEMDNADGLTLTADLNINYPAELKVTEPEEYIDIETLMQEAMAQFLTGLEGSTTTDE